MSEVIRLASETDIPGWRVAARRLRGRGVAPDNVLWTVDAAQPSPQAADCRVFTVPRGFLDLAARGLLHRSDERFDLFYRLLWRLGREPGLLDRANDAEVARARVLAAEVGRELHRIKAFLQFRLVSDPEGPETHAAWFVPAHRITEAAAPFFMQRLRAGFSILTPDVCIHWDGSSLQLSAGVDPADAPLGVSLEDYWRSRYGRIFARGWNPVRSAPIPGATGAPKDPLVAMAATRQAEPDRRAARAVQRAARDAPYDGAAPADLQEVALGVRACRRCDLWRGTTQGVAGQGPARARIMLVGEQPGDQEDLAGQPFVGPAGKVLDRALAGAGAPRGELYVTNVVKHFKHELRGKRRLHKTPDAGEVSACRWWLDAERRLVRPRVIVALGATAALSVFGKPIPIGKNRGQALQLADQAQGVVTYHPSYLLRIPDEAAKAAAFEQFVADLRFARRLAA